MPIYVTGCLQHMPSKWHVLVTWHFHTVIVIGKCSGGGVVERWLREVVDVGGGGGDAAQVGGGCG